MPSGTSHVARLWELPLSLDNPAARPLEKEMSIPLARYLASCLTCHPTRRWPEALRYSEERWSHRRRRFESGEGGARYCFVECQLHCRFLIQRQTRFKYCKWLDISEFADASRPDR